MGNSRKQSGVGGVLWVGAEGHSPTPGAEWGGKRNEAPPLSAEGKGTWLSLLLPHPVHGRGRVLVPSLPSRAQKLFPVEPLEEAFAELISADHDGAGRGGLDDPREEACSGEEARVRGRVPGSTNFTRVWTYTQRRPPAKRPLVPDSARILRSSSHVESVCGGITANPGPIRPRGAPPALPHTSQGSSPLTASTAPSATWR